jgi:hypothetical protein
MLVQRDAWGLRIWMKLDSSALRAPAHGPGRDSPCRENTHDAEALVPTDRVGDATGFDDDNESLDSSHVLNRITSDRTIQSKG